MSINPSHVERLNPSLAQAQVEGLELETLATATDRIQNNLELAALQDIELPETAEAPKAESLWMELIEDLLSDEQAPLEFAHDVVEIQGESGEMIEAVQVPGNVGVFL